MIKLNIPMQFKTKKMIYVSEYKNQRLPARYPMMKAKPLKILKKRKRRQLIETTLY